MSGENLGADVSINRSPAELLLFLLLPHVLPLERVPQHPLPCARFMAEMGLPLLAQILLQVAAGLLTFDLLFNSCGWLNVYAQQCYLLFLGFLSFD